MAWGDESGTQVEARTPSERALALAPPRPQLYVVLDCAHPDGASRHDLGDVDEVRVGRGQERSAHRTTVDHKRVLELTLPDALASQGHARIVASGEGFVLEDLGARNGTWLDGMSITQSPLHDGAVLQIGRTLLVFRSAVPTPFSASADVDTRTLVSPLPGVTTLLPWYATRLDALARVARSGATVLLLGETGTGKEVLARAVHAVARPRSPFVAVNCGAMPAGLVESQLFGHVRGAFSGAVRDEIGFVRAAHGGTLFLDEIVDLPKSSQAALLRVLQEREVVPVGSTRPVPVDIRVIAATHADVEALVQRGDFRTDLLARISGFVFQVPPLRERREDIGVLTSALLSRLAPERTGVSFEPDAAAALLSHGWRHNIRELEHALAVALALADVEIGLDHLPPALAGLTSSAPPPASSRPSDEESAALRSELSRLLAKHAGNVSAVAREMGRARPLVHRWLRRYRIDAATFRGPGSGAGAG